MLAAVVVLVLAVLVAPHVLGAVRPAPARVLDAELERRVGEAIAAAGSEGVELWVTSGFRSAEEQAALFAEAVATHGSEREAARWVLPPELSAHVVGLAVDVGPAAGAAWLGARAEEFGLCRVFENEPWHFELRGARGCPELLPDPSALLD